MKYRSCEWIENFGLNLMGRIDTGGKCMSLCCVPIADGPGTPLCGSAQESMEEFRRRRAELIAESVRFSLLDLPENERKFTVTCAGCAYFQSGDHGNFDGLIHHVALGMTPAPCQCKCVYCDAILGGNSTFKKSFHADYYEKVFGVIDYAENQGMIAPDACWNVASGEIAIHPYRNRILDCVNDRKVTFFTNCFIFDERLADILASNPRSSIHFSIDSGTPETWCKLKGVDNFDAVTDNLVKYHKRAARPKQITLKYIVLPGLNDNPADYTQVIAIMKVLQIGHLVITRDEREIGRRNKPLIDAAAYLAAMLVKNAMSFDLYSYTQDERDEIAARGCEWLQSGSNGKNLENL